FGSTVLSFRLMLASAELVTCSPGENRELYALAMGGYGLLGVIVDVEAAIAENSLLHARSELLPTADFVRRMVGRIAQAPLVRMATARLGFDADRFVPDYATSNIGAGADIATSAKYSGFMVSLSRQVFRAQIGSDAAKRARWYAETV